MDKIPRPENHPSILEFLDNTLVEYLKLRLIKMWSTKSARKKILADIQYIRDLERENKEYKLKFGKL